MTVDKDSLASLLEKTATYDKDIIIRPGKFPHDVPGILIQIGTGYTVINAATADQLIVDLQEQSGWLRRAGVPDGNVVTWPYPTDTEVQ
jgi:hypothetical protein